MFVKIFLHNKQGTTKQTQAFDDFPNIQRRKSEPANNMNTSSQGKAYQIACEFSIKNNYLEAELVTHKIRESQKDLENEALTMENATMKKRLQYLESNNVLVEGQAQRLAIDSKKEITNLENEVFDLKENVESFATNEEDLEQTIIKKNSELEWAGNEIQQLWAANSCLKEEKHKLMSRIFELRGQQQLQALPKYVIAPNGHVMPLYAPAPMYYQ